MNIVDLILSNPEQANSAIADSLQARVFDYLDNYQLAEESIDEVWAAPNPDNVDKKYLKNLKSRVFAKSKQKDTTPIKSKVTKEDLDAMNQEEFEALVEDFEQLDELSKATLGSYLDKAKQSFKTNAQNMVKPGPEGDAAYNKIWRGTLRKGINRATDRLTKEDLDEESKMSQQQWEDNRAHKATAAAKKDVEDRDPETARRRKQMELLFPSNKTAGK